MPPPSQFSDATERSADLVVVDIGNSAAKFCRYREVHGDAPKPAGSIRTTIKELCNVGALERVVDALFGPADAPSTIRWYVATVQHQAEQALRNRIEQRCPTDTYQRLANRDVPITVDVDHPEQVGIDRLLAACAANRLRESTRHAIVVDAGSAITVDWVSSAGRFRGGAILPGVRMQTRALNRGAERLPAIDLSAEQLGDAQLPGVGRSTESAIRYGVLVGIFGAVREIVQRIMAEAGQQAQVFVTGGDAPLLRSMASSDVRFVPDLVLMGIYFSALSASDAG